jgi:Z1 domain
MGYMTIDINTTTKTETVEIILREHSQFAGWTPMEGDETFKLLDHLKFIDTDRETVEREAISVLAQCVPPTLTTGTETGLVIGYIQSGKTTSFTTVAALAKDNGYRLIIVITGLTKNLFKQSNDRLEKDLRLIQRTDRKWQYLSNPKARTDIKQRITTALQRDDALPGVSKQTVLITVMKNRTHLMNLITLLSNVSLVGVPTLVIDDEADQASLNNLVRKGKESATYRRILQIRQLLPQHTFLQYTATPQAPLLINIIDKLSPNFAALLTPGPAYTGGKIFFEKDLRLIRRIRENEVPSKDQTLAEPPESLLEAMRIFFLGVAAGLRSREEGKNRSMMVHPSKETMQHANYGQWVRDIQQYWANTLRLPMLDLDRQELIEDFKKAYDDLHNTVENLATFDDLLAYLSYAVDSTIVTTVNAANGPTPQPDWRQDYAHILVGGEVLNRGYTIEGLIVTYIPRSKGAGNTDTIQQRARWFGYKAEYLGYCRVYLTDEQRNIYKEYVTQEENVRNQLRNHAETGKSLHEWRRAFFLSPDLRPTRHEILDLEYVRGNYSSDWFEQHAPHDSPEAIEANRRIVNDFLAKLSPLQPDTRHPSQTDMQKHQVTSNVSLDFAYRELLTKFLVTRPDDSHQFVGLLLQLGRYLEQHPNETGNCTIYLMSSGQLRERSVDDDDKIPNLFQGRNPDKTGKNYYPGDQQIHSPQGITIQIHRLNVLKDKSVVAEDVPTIAIFLPKEMSANWIVQTDKKAGRKFGRPCWD